MKEMFPFKKFLPNHSHLMKHREEWFNWNEFNVTNEAMVGVVLAMWIYTIV